MKSVTLTQLRAELAQQEAAARTAAELAAATDAAAAKAAAAATDAAAAEARTAEITAAQRQARAQALAAKAARRDQLIARRRHTAVAKVQPHGWTAETAKAAAAARAAEQEANWVALAKAKAKAKAKAARAAAGVLSLTAIQMAKAKKAKAERNKEADVYSAAHVAKQERKALLASIAEYRNARKWAAKKGRNAVLLARLVLKEAMPVAAAKAVVAKLATKRQAKAGR